MPFKDNLKKLRKEKKVTQADLAKALNISRATIAGYESKGKEPSYNILIEISNFFDVSIDYLLTGENYHGYIPLDKSKQYIIDLEFQKNISELTSDDVKRLKDYIELLKQQDIYK